MCNFLRGNVYLCQQPLDGVVDGHVGEVARSCKLSGLQAPEALGRALPKSAPSSLGEARFVLGKVWASCELPVGGGSSFVVKRVANSDGFEHRNVEYLS